MSSDLKADLLRDALSRSPNGDPEWLLQLRARLERSTVVEPERHPKACPSCGQGLPKPPPPTDAELLDALRAELGEGWSVQVKSSDPEWFGVQARRATPSCGLSMAALRKPNGPRDCAAALKVLAGEGE